MKRCFKCEQEKPRTEFYRHPQMGDQLLGKCKECTKRDMGITRKANLDYYRAYDRERGKTPERKAETAARTKVRRATKSGYQAAHNAVARAIVKGLINRAACLMCGDTKVVAHHDDYSKPLDVMWLCTVHHKARHAFLEMMEATEAIAA